MRQKMIPMEEMPEASDRQPDSVLRDAIECLPEEMRIPLLLHYMEGYKLREIAGTLGVDTTWALDSDNWVTSSVKSRERWA